MQVFPQATEALCHAVIVLPLATVPHGPAQSEQLATVQDWLAYDPDSVPFVQVRVSLEQVFPHVTEALCHAVMLLPLLTVVPQGAVQLLTLGTQLFVQVQLPALQIAEQVPFWSQFPETVAPLPPAVRIVQREPAAPLEVGEQPGAQLFVKVQEPAVHRA